MIYVSVQEKPNSMEVIYYKTYLVTTIDYFLYLNEREITIARIVVGYKRPWIFIEHKEKNNAHMNHTVTQRVN